MLQVIWVKKSEKLEVVVDRKSFTVSVVEERSHVEIQWLEEQLGLEMEDSLADLNSFLDLETEGKKSEKGESLDPIRLKGKFESDIIVRRDRKLREDQGKDRGKVVELNKENGPNVDGSNGGLQSSKVSTIRKSNQLKDCRSGQSCIGVGPKQFSPMKSSVGFVRGPVGSIHTNEDQLGHQLKGFEGCQDSSLGFNDEESPTPNPLRLFY
ncbi:hypothetical protein LWI29_019571 [Acer saccharum]|uniref:Uncharacterized protein n=1 Tax=Acer saccharum TaxID=4024 RepID=A0AA39SM57_ACESA|nr:hypothetical protein LWI29_019571 [Acer saccharum]